MAEVRAVEAECLDDPGTSGIDAVGEESWTPISRSLRRRSTPRRQADVGRCLRASGVLQ